MYNKKRGAFPPRAYVMLCYVMQGQRGRESSRLRASHPPALPWRRLCKVHHKLQSLLVPWQSQLVLLRTWKKGRSPCRWHRRGLALGQIGATRRR